MEWLMKMASSWRPTQYCLEAYQSDRDVFLWEREIQQYANGELSYAVLQGNDSLEDRSQVESNILRTFVGIYDGHGGDEVAQHVNEHLFRNFENEVHRTGCISPEVLRHAFLTTDEELLGKHRDVARAAGSCCLVGVISEQNLYVANAGDSRCVLGTAGKHRSIVAIQLSDDHNAAIESVQQELNVAHPDDPGIVEFYNGAWRVKGVIQVSRAIGDIYLKEPGKFILSENGIVFPEAGEVAPEAVEIAPEAVEIALPEIARSGPGEIPLPEAGEMVFSESGEIAHWESGEITRSGPGEITDSEPGEVTGSGPGEITRSGPRVITLTGPVLTADPSIRVRELQPDDRFVVFASDGLWDHLSNQEVVEFVHRHPRRGIARRLAEAAVREAARKTNESYLALKRSVKNRRSVHDDITVVVMFLDNRSACRCFQPRNLSIVGRSSQAPWCCCSC